jgi:hypothetical protein
MTKTDKDIVSLSLLEVAGSARSTKTCLAETASLRVESEEIWSLVWVKEANNPCVGEGLTLRVH